MERRVFLRALREGKGHDGALLYPAMPYPYYAKVTERDALAIRAYLNTVQPVRNRVVSNELPFPFDVREEMKVWNALYFKSGEFKPDAAKSAEWNRGAYLVEGLGHCSACHTPKTTLGGDDLKHAFQGYALQGWFAPNITNDNERGLGGWSIADIVSYLKTGHNAIGASTGIMAEEISLSSSQMTDADLTAIATYLKDLPGQTSSSPAAVSASDPIMVAGGAIYADECSACHGMDGKGVPFLFPSLAGSPNVRSTDPTSLVRVLIEGARSVATAGERTGPGMPSFAWKLDDAEIAAVLTYTRNSWGSSAPAVDAPQVAQSRAGAAMASGVITRHIPWPRVIAAAQIGMRVNRPASTYRAWRNCLISSAGGRNEGSTRTPRRQPMYIMVGATEMRPTPTNSAILAQKKMLTQ